MLRPAVEKNERWARLSGPCDVHAQPRRLDDLVIDAGNCGQVAQHSVRSLRSVLLSRDATGPMVITNDESRFGSEAQTELVLP